MPIRQQKIESEVTDALFCGLLRTKSQPRLNPYLVSAGHDRNRAVALYVWNAVIGQAFHFPLQAAEVSLRNCINLILIDVWGPDWWKNPKFRTWVLPERVTNIDEAEKRIKARSYPLVTDQIVATLSFGFWVSMLQKRYNPELWNKRIRDAFPNFPKGQNHEAIYRTAGAVLDFRNEVFHHEPIITKDLSGNYGNIMVLLKWMCPETEAWVRSQCSVPVIIRMKP